MRLPVYALLLALAMFSSGCGNSRISKENAAKISSGMSEAEVESILGAPSSSVEAKVPDMTGMMKNMPQGMGKDMSGMMKMPPLGAKIKVWQEGNRSITVTFDEAGKVWMVVSGGF
jgi:hypothetical protein